MDDNKTIGYSAKERQKERLDERRRTKLITTNVCGLSFKIKRGVYQTAKDTELMAKVIQINNHETFLEIGCGCGAISIILSKKAKEGLGIDINPLAIDNSKLNAEIHKTTNVSFNLGDVFENIKNRFDVILFNPPYSSFNFKDEIDRMFWDSGNISKINFFKNVKKYLKPEGRIYFGWADFDDLDKDLPVRLSHETQLIINKVYTQRVKDRPYTYEVYEFIKEI